jgi:phage FluMu protein Com
VSQVRVYALEHPAVGSAELRPWRCAGTLTSGRPCEKLLAEVDFERPMYVRIVCGRCGKENLLVERHLTPGSATMGTSITSDAGLNP